MTESTPPVLPEAIHEVVQQIVDCFKPQKILLFGSYATGMPTPDSDVDLLVLMETAENPLHTAARISAAVDHRFPLDILVFRPSEWRASIARKGVFATDISGDGVVVYEA